jgi:hypothetical protein
VTQIRWLVTAIIAATACQLAVHHATPIDRALPFIAVIVTAIAARSYPSLMMGVPLLIAAEIAIPDERTRLLGFGVVVAAVFAIALHPSSAFGTFSPRGGEKATQSHPSPLRRGEKVPQADEGSLSLAIAAILLLRWIPFSEVRLGRELFLLAIGALIVLVLERTPFAVAIAVLTVLVTPAIPMRTLLLPIAVLLVAILAKLFGMPKVRLALPSTIAVAFVLLFFAWSGVVARAFPYFLQRAKPDFVRTMVAALPANESLTLEVPPGAKSLVVSGANVAKMPRGTPLGRVDSHVIRIGDAADWGYLRREHFYGTRNPLPRDPAGRLRDYGYAAWVDGAGRVPLPPRARVIRITADAGLPSGASLQVEGFE